MLSEDSAYHDNEGTVKQPKPRQPEHAVEAVSITVDKEAWAGYNFSGPMHLYLLPGGETYLLKISELGKETF